VSFIINTIATAITFAIVAYFYPDIDYGDQIGTLLVVAIVFGVVNAFIKPIVKVFSLPLTVMTLGLFGVVINAAMLLLVAWLTDLFGLTFTVGGFPPEFGLSAIVTAIIGAILISIVGTIVHLVVPER
jgi:putative membrane protein